LVVWNFFFLLKATHKSEKKNEIQPRENDIEGDIEVNQIETETDPIV